MKNIFAFITFIFLSFSALASNMQQLWVSVSPTKELYVEYYAPQKNKPTVVLLHGLTYTTHQWEKFIQELTSKGFGVVCYDMEGMGQTLLKYAPIKAIIPITNHFNDLNVLLAKLNIPKPYNLIGLSYGGGVAFGYAVKYPKNINKLILMAPYTKPLKKVEDYLNSQVTSARLLNPLNPYSDKQVFEFFFRQFVYSTYPMQEPIVLENPYKLEAVFRLSQGTSAFIPENNISKITVPTYLLIAEKDQYFPKTEYDNYWSLFSDSVKKGFYVIKNSEHKIPESQPEQAANIIESILN